MRTRRTYYSHYGISESELKVWKQKCRNADKDFERLMSESAKKVNPFFQKEIFDSLRYNMSFEDLDKREYMPVGKEDFYGYQRATIFSIKEEIMRQDELLQKYFSETGVIRRICTKEEAADELKITMCKVRSLAKEANALIILGGIKRIDMNALYSYIDENCKRV